MRDRLGRRAALAALLLALSAPARAEPAFSAAERAVIARNASLRTALERDPDLARRALDLIEAPRTRALEPDVPSRSTRDLPLSPGGPPAFDAGADPDLGRLQRASPEAAHDLFQLLKQASSGTKR